MLFVFGPLYAGFFVLLASLLMGCATSSPNSGGDCPNLLPMSAASEPMALADVFGQFAAEY